MPVLTVKPLDSDVDSWVSGVYYVPLYYVPLVTSCSLISEFKVPKAEKIEQ